ncbi:MAG TPA: hypothetical protein VMB23_02660 [Spirochaetia bacterium]|nr:hypothetical protein [Spirochaetia bacterium]
MTVADIASVILALSGTLSLLYIARQLAVSQRQAKGQFLLALDDRFSQSRAILARFVADPNFSPQGEEWPQVWALMSIFERLNIMVEDRIVDIAIVDRLHGYLLLGLVANDAVFERLKTTAAEWQDFIDLCHAIARHHKRRRSGPRHAAFIDRVATLDKNAPLTRNPWAY